MIKTFKVKLHPNNFQNTRMHITANKCIDVYNLLCALFSYDPYKFPKEQEFRKFFTEIKKITSVKKELKEIGLTKNQISELGCDIDYDDVSNDSLKQTIKDFYRARKNYYEKRASKPKFKSKFKGTKGFYVDPYKIKFISNKVKLEKISLSNKPNKQIKNWVKLAEKDRIPLDSKYYNPRVIFDGISWWLCVGNEVYNENKVCTNTNEGIGIDQGVKQLALSTNEVIPNINKSKEVRRLNKKLKRSKRSLSRMINRAKSNKIKLYKCKNFKKRKIEIKRIYQRLSNIRENHQNQIINDLIKKKPSFIAIEDLNVRELMKNKHLSRSIQDSRFNTFMVKLKHKCEQSKIPLVYVDTFFPSSKMCSRCKRIKSDLKLKDRIYKCDNCGYTIDRDINASINICEYGKKNIIDINRLVRRKRKYKQVI